MASSGYVADTFVAGEQPTTAKWNELWGNDASFNSGNGFNDNILVTRHFATSGLQLPDKMLNPYKFSVYRAAAQTSNSAPTVINFDTTLFDTGSNVDITTNKGRFTAPVAGFYCFTGFAGNTAATTTETFTYLFKNGSNVKSGAGAVSSASTGTHSIVTGLIKLAAGDYVEVYFQGGNGSVMNTGAPNCYFDGYLVSAT